MHSIYQARKKEEEEARKRVSSPRDQLKLDKMNKSNRHLATLDRAIRSNAHRDRTAALSASHHARVEEWMAATLAAEVPPLPPKPLTMADISVRPYQFYRKRWKSSSTKGQTSSGSQSARLGSSSARSTWDVPLTHLHLPAQQDPDDLPDHVQISPRKWQSETARLAAYEASSDHQLLASREPYSDPLAYEYRRRDRAAEVAGPFVYRPQNERQRVQEAITYRDVGGASYPWESPKLYPEYRVEQKEKWRAGHFSARLPPIPILGPIPRVEEPYLEPIAAGASNAASSTLFRPDAPIPESLSHRARFTGLVPTDRFLCLPESNPRAPKPPVDEIAGGHTLNAGLNSSGIWGGQFNHKTKKVEPVKERTYWKSAIRLAHEPHPVGSQTTREDSRTTAQQLVKTYQQHLAY